MAAKNYYNILGVPKSSSEKEIHQAYRRLARKYHPDVNPGDKKTEDKFKEINEAYQVLSDPEQREEYDQNGRGFRFSGPSGGKRDPFVWRYETSGSGTDVDLDLEFGSSPLDDILGSVMRGRGRGPFQDSFTMRPPSEIEHPIEVTLEEAYHGTTRTIEFVDQERCLSCGGRGGSCPRCSGTGVIQKNRRLEVKVPAGVKTGPRVRVSPGRGKDVSEVGVKTIYLVVTVRPHSRFDRKEDDLRVEVSVPLLTAVLGGEVDVSTLTSKVALKIPPYTQNGRVFRLAGKGMPVLGASRKGDLHVKVRASLPSSLREDELAMFRQLKDLRESRGAE